LQAVGKITESLRSAGQDRAPCRTETWDFLDSRRMVHGRRERAFSTAKAVYRGLTVVL
jgi:hypothetical protein